ncbi:hypothetical protein HK098_006154 [Nowakowskiella sp. JEL0407]|nr:hypothetical protein HK098_006154 [Nowakowskiella sp. JEL0407]
MGYLKVMDWWLGMGLMTLGECGNFAAYGFAPAVLVAPLGTVGLIANAILAPIFLKEKFRRRDLLGIFFAILGTSIIIIVSSQTDEPILTPEDIARALGQTQFIIYVIITSIFAIIMAYLSPTPFGSRYIFVDLSLVAVAGGYTVLSTKAISSFLNLNVVVVFTYSVTYAMLAVLIATAVLQIKYLNKSLSRFDSTEVIPTNFVLFTTSTIIGSAVLYHDFSRMSQHAVILSLLGISCMFLGVSLITGKRRTSTSHATEHLEHHGGDIDQVEDEHDGVISKFTKTAKKSFMDVSRKFTRSGGYMQVTVEDDTDVKGSVKGTLSTVASGNGNLGSTSLARAKSIPSVNGKERGGGYSRSLKFDGGVSSGGTGSGGLGGKRASLGGSLSGSIGSLFGVDGGEERSREVQLDQIAQSYLEHTRSPTRT